MRHNICTILLLACSILYSEEEKKLYGWINADEVGVRDGMVALDTCRGMAYLPLLEYDSQNNRYLVECLNIAGEVYPEPLKEDR